MNVLIYSKDDCKYCRFAKRLLKEHGLDYEERNIYSNDQYMKEFKAIFKDDEPNTTPQVFIDEKRVGGFDKLTVLLATYQNGGEKGKYGEVDES